MAGTCRTRRVFFARQKTRKNVSGVFVAVCQCESDTTPKWILEKRVSKFGYGLFAKIPLKKGFIVEDEIFEQNTKFVINGHVDEKLENEIRNEKAPEFAIFETLEDLEDFVEKFGE